MTQYVSKKGKESWKSVGCLKNGGHCCHSWWPEKRWQNEKKMTENNRNPDTERLGHVYEAFTPVYEGVFQLF